MVGTLVICQTWSKIDLYFDGVDNQCDSKVAAISALTPNRWEFVWQYQSTFKDQKTASSQGAERIHHGTSLIKAAADQDQLPYEMKGSYYTDENRKSYGNVFFTRRPSPLV